MNDQQTIKACPVCEGSQSKAFVEIEQTTVFANVLWGDRDAAMAAPRAGISLGFCAECGMLHNMRFDPELVRYTPRYENALDHSPRFQLYADRLARRLVRTYNLRGKDIVEIGCGQGNFLAMLALLGDNRAVGYDPSYDARAADAEVRSRTSIRREYFAADTFDGPIDLLCCRHVLEHVHDPYSFLTDIRAALADQPDAAVYFEVPNALFTLRDLGIWDIIYEHCSYFTAESLTRLFDRAGFVQTTVAEQFGGQFLSIEARPEGIAGDRSDRVRAEVSSGELVRRFQRAYDSKVQTWRERLLGMSERKSRPVIWGAGSKGITFLNVLQVPWEQMPYAVDLNPRKHGRFVAGTGQEIIPSTFLSTYQPDAVIVMNPIYEEEITQSLNQLGVDAEVHVA